MSEHVAQAEPPLQADAICPFIFDDQKEVSAIADAKTAAADAKTDDAPEKARVKRRLPVSSALQTVTMPISFSKEIFVVRS